MKLFNIRVAELAIVTLCLCGLSSSYVQQPGDENSKKTVDELRKQMKDVNKLVHSGYFDHVQADLAHFGELKQLQEIRCEIDFGASRAVKDRAISKLREVGGWFAISALSRFLEDDPHNDQGDQDSHNAYPPLRFEALQLLPHIVPNPPLGEVSYYRGYSKENAIWKEWLAKQHGSLIKLQPTGEGVVSSEHVCRKVLKDDPDRDPYPGHSEIH